MDDLDRIKSLAGLDEAMLDPNNLERSGPELPSVQRGGGFSYKGGSDIGGPSKRSFDSDFTKDPTHGGSVGFGASLLGHLGLAGAAALSARGGSPETAKPTETPPETAKPTVPPTAGPKVDNLPGQTTTSDAGEKQTPAPSVPDVDVNRVKRSQQMFGIPGVQEENTSLSLLKRLAGL